MSVRRRAAPRSTTASSRRRIPTGPSRSSAVLLAAAVWASNQTRRQFGSRHRLNLMPHRYDDGEIETYVNKKFITVTRAKSRSRSRSKSDDSRSKKKRRDRSRSSSSTGRAVPKRGRKLREGDKCTARFRGKSGAKYYPGKVTYSFGRHYRCEIDAKYDDVPSAGTTTETWIRTSRPSTSKPSTPVPIPTAARGRSGATGAAAQPPRSRSPARAQAPRGRQVPGPLPGQIVSKAVLIQRLDELVLAIFMQCRRYPGKVVKIHSDGTVDVKRVTAWKSRLAHAIDAFPGLPHSVDDVRTGTRTATATRGSRRST